MKSYTGETKSYEGQSDASYCAECLVTHYSTVVGLLEEAERLSQHMVDRPWVSQFKIKARELRKQYLIPILAAPWRKDLLSDAISKAKELYNLALDVLRKELVEEQYSDVEKELVKYLTYFINLGDIKYLEKSVRLAKQSKCSICLNYAAKAYELAKSGNIEEARKTANILRLGIQKWMEEVASKEETNISDSKIETGDVT